MPWGWEISGQRGKGVNLRRGEEDICGQRGGGISLRRGEGEGGWSGGVKVRVESGCVGTYVEIKRSGAAS